MDKSETAWSLTNIVSAGMMLIVVIATIAGLIQLTKKKKPNGTATAYTTPAPHPDNAELVQARSERDEAIRLLQEQRLQAVRTTQAKDIKCVDGILFGRVEGELRNIGHCQK